VCGSLLNCRRGISSCKDIEARHCGNALSVHGQSGDRRQEQRTFVGACLSSCTSTALSTASFTAPRDTASTPACCAYCVFVCRVSPSPPPLPRSLSAIASLSLNSQGARSEFQSRQAGVARVATGLRKDSQVCTCGCRRRRDSQDSRTDWPCSLGALQSCWTPRLNSNHSSSLISALPRYTQHCGPEILSHSQQQ
jgi:hypothetical protein